MSRERDRPTLPACSLIDLDIKRPFPGQRVLALTLGGKLVETVWSEREADFYDAWAVFPDVPASVKAKQNKRIEKGLMQ